MKPNQPIYLYILKFLGLFAVLFYGTEGVIALASPGDHYIPFVARYLDVVSLFRTFLLLSAQGLLALGGWTTLITDAYTLAFPEGASVRMVYSCLGYGVLSFWIAFVFANKGDWRKKAVWMIGGCILLIGINVIRIVLIVLAAQKQWDIPLGWDHHTWFTIVAYILIFVMIYWYDRTTKIKHASPSEQNNENSRAQVHPMH